MNLFGFDVAINDLIDPETGEVKDYDAFLALTMEREEKKERIALWIKELNATAKAMKAEEDSMKERRSAVEAKAESLTRYLQTYLDGEKFSTPKVAVSYRKSQVVEVDDEFLNYCITHEECESFLRYKKPEIDKTAIKNAVKVGIEVPHATVTEKVNMTIK